ncbi:MAG: hypothetical protein PHE61_07660 [Candidatus Omnitrophica bacterium]|nr:hypothetical protein [Candidatus Omnitrophota bacterium]
MAAVELKKREIGSVVVFDLFGHLEEGKGETLRDDLEGEIQKENHINVILNLQGIESSDEITLRKVLVTLERPVRKAIFCDSDEVFKLLRETYLSGGIPITRSEEEIVELFGAYLLEKGKKVGKRDRRRNPRMKVAIPVGLDFQTPNAGLLTTKAIVTNVSEGGIFAEYLNWKSALEVKKLEGAKNVGVKIIFRHPKTENTAEINGAIVRIEHTNDQVGLAVQYVKR